MLNFYLEGPELLLPWLVAGVQVDIMQKETGLWWRGKVSSRLEQVFTIMYPHIKAEQFAITSDCKYLMNENPDTSTIRHNYCHFYKDRCLAYFV